MKLALEFCASGIRYGSGFQIQFASEPVFTPGDAPDVLVAMNPAALKANLGDLTQNGILRPYDMALGMREAFNGPAFQSGTYHGFVSNEGGDNVLIYQSGPDGLGGIGYDDIVGDIRPNVPVDEGLKEMIKPQGITYFPNYPLDTGGFTVGAIVAHKDENGQAVASAVMYTKDTSPGQNLITVGSLGPSAAPPSARRTAISW